MLHSLRACVAKEWRILLRDREGLAILFAMPVMFVVIMSLALQDFFQQNAAPRITLVLADADGDHIGRDLGAALAQLQGFKVETRAITPSAWDLERARVAAEVNAAAVRFALLVPPGASEAHARALTAWATGAATGATTGLASGMPAPVLLELLADPGVRADHRALAVATIDRALAGIELREIARRFSPGGAPPAGTAAQGFLTVKDARTAPNDSSDTGSRVASRPNSTQQNVPAYLLLAIFMLVVPLSGTFIKERDQGSLTRLRSMPVPTWAIIGGKVVPYVCISLAQVAVCLAVGRYLLPWLGGDALAFGHSYAGIVVLTLAAGIAAVGFALAISMLARTPEQATAFGATAVLILAALGGVMVPTMLMPPAMAALGAWSPIGWALAGFLDLFVRDAGLAAVLPRAAALIAFGAVCLAFALVRFNRLGRV